METAVEQQAAPAPDASPAESPRLAPTAEGGEVGPVSETGQAAESTPAGDPSGDAQGEGREFPEEGDVTAGLVETGQLPNDNEEDAGEQASQPARAATPQKKKRPEVNSKDYFQRPESALPPDVELANARNFLLQNSGKSDTNLYDHLSSVLMRVLEQRPGNAVDIFETISADVKRENFQPSSYGLGTQFKSAADKGKAVELAEIQSRLLAGIRNDDKNAIPEVETGDIPDIMELASLFEWGGVSFGREETFLLLLSLRKLVEERNLKSVRLWGKILGTQADYYVVEAETKDGARDEAQLESTANKGEDENDRDAEGAGGEEGEEGGDRPGEAPRRYQEIGCADEDGNVQYWFEPGTVVPRPKQPATPVVPPEIGTGSNKYTYYVCNFPGGPWYCLPDAIPEKLQVARKIRKYFTGNLLTKIVSYPPFNGSEAQYLRCQIARISAATVISPAGYYTFDSEDQDAEEAEASAAIIMNPEFEGLPNDALLQLTNWVHHVPYILPQGRVSWVNPFEGQGGRGGEDEDDDEEEDDEQNDESAGATRGESGESTEPETGPPILSSIGVDADHGDAPRWTARTCSTLSPMKYTPVTLRSLSWPGAVVIAYMDKFANIYVGDGLKDLGGQPYSSAQLPEMQKEYVSSPDQPETDVTEAVDPSVEEETAHEEARRLAQEENAEESDNEDEDNGEDEEA